MRVPWAEKQTEYFSRRAKFLVLASSRPARRFSRGWCLLGRGRLLAQVLVRRWPAPIGVVPIEIFASLRLSFGLPLLP